MGCHPFFQGNLPDPRIKPTSPALQADSLPSEPPGKPKPLAWLVSILSPNVFSQSSFLKFTFFLPKLTHPSITAWGRPGLEGWPYCHQRVASMSAPKQLLQSLSSLSYFSHVWLFATPWTAALQAPLSMRRHSPVKNTGVGCHALLWGIFPTLGSKLCLFPALAGGFFTTSATWEVPISRKAKKQAKKGI